MTQTSFYPCYDRFIDPKPERYAYNHNFSYQNTSFQDLSRSNYSQLIKKNLFGPKKTLDDETSTIDTKNSHSIRNLDINLPQCKPSNEDKNILSPVKILDVPNIRDDFYLNLVDWHHKGLVGVALNDEVYICAPNEISKIAKSPFNTYISSLKFNQSILSIGISNGFVQIYDLQRSSLIRTFKNHQLRVSSMSFSQNLMITGSKDKTINFNDLRLKMPLTKILNEHKGQICSIKVKPDQKNIFASGGNDNKVCIWDVRYDTPSYTIKAHKGAVKAISWCPWRANTLATGGGINDKTIKIWDGDMKLVCQKQLQSQISGLEWNSKLKCLISSHGSNSNQVIIWRWDKFNKLSRINGSKSYSKRVLNLMQSKQEDMVCTLSSDETLKFFQLLQPSYDQKIDQKSHQGNCFQRIL